MKIELSPLCTQSQIKANTGRNTTLKLLSNISALWPAGNSINERINYKAFYANPQQYYLDIKENDLYERSTM